MKLCFRLFAILFILPAFFAVKAQENQPEIKILRQASQKGFGCYFDNGVMPESEFEKIRAEKDCGSLRSLEIDFEKESLIAFYARGDCFLSATAKVFQNSEKKKNIVEVTKTSGGCRAAGSFYGLLVIEKIPPGYSTEFVEKRSVKAEIKNVYKEWKNSDVIHLGSKPDFETIDLKNCVRSKQFVIRNQNELLNALRSDASRDWCLENLPEIDFTENSLIGIELTTDYCTRPKGLKYEILRDAENKKLFFNISYDDAQGNRCARIGFYDISLLVPKIPGEWEVKFDVKINPPENR